MNEWWRKREGVWDKTCENWIDWSRVRKTDKVRKWKSWREIIEENLTGRSNDRPGVREWERRTGRESYVWEHGGVGESWMMASKRDCVTEDLWDLDRFIESRKDRQGEKMRELEKKSEKIWQAGRKTDQSVKDWARKTGRESVWVVRSARPIADEKDGEREREKEWKRESDREHEWKFDWGIMANWQSETVPWDKLGTRKHMTDRLASSKTDRLRERMKKEYGREDQQKLDRLRERDCWRENMRENFERQIETNTECERLSAKNWARENVWENISVRQITDEKSEKENKQRQRVEVWLKNWKIVRTRELERDEQKFDMHWLKKRQIECERLSAEKRSRVSERR